MRLFAPGKLFLSGEYAVLWGAPAVLAAVSPGLQAAFELRSDGEIALRVPGGASRGVRQGDRIDWRGPEAPARFARRALELALGDSARGLSLRMDDGARGPKNQKLGLGGSASAAVLAAAAGRLARGLSIGAAEVFPVAAEAHWEVQGRRGSHGDVAASCHGGLIRYLRWPLERSPRPPPEISALPDCGLELALVFSGRSAKTPSMVSAVEAAFSAEARARFVAESTALTDALCEALAHRREADARRALDAAGDLLARLGQQTGVEVVTPTLARIAHVGRAHGLAAKVSGAGGGDGALLAGFDPEAMTAARQALQREGFTSIEPRISGGLRAEPG